MSPDKKDKIAQLEHQLARADAVAAQKSNFLATISHEIRTPMQSVYGLLELIEQEKPAGNIMTMVQTARDSASGLLEILDDILDFAKMDADQMVLDNFEIPLRTLVRGINEALSVKIQQGKNVMLIDDIEEDVPFVIAGDPKRLRQILMNLVGNAIKFTEEGSVVTRITKTTQKITPDKEQMGLRFEVIDTGIGMTDEAAGRLFKPFSQADNSTSRRFGGTGLGLSICKKLVEMMEGQIGVKSVEGSGSTFWFEIPTTEVDTDSDVTQELPNLDGFSVLSVEDHPQGAKEIKRSLESIGAKVESCGTYAEALELIIRRPFDVAIIDQGLPDGLGLDLIRELIDIRPFTGIIMYTVRDDAGLQHTLQSLGVTYLAKPASRLGLAEEVLNAASKVKKMAIEGPTKLLIAEDTASIRDVLQRQLDTIGVEATFVENGEQALNAVRSGEYGILLTDLHMPGMDGYQVIEEIRKDDEKLDRHFPVIALTADVQMNQRQIYMSHGFDECLLKPVSLGQFKRLLVRWGLIDSSGQDNAPDKSDGGDKPRSSETSAIDIDAIADLMGGFDESTIEMLNMFADMTEPLIAKMEQALRDGDVRQLAEEAHSLKGSARSACAKRLGDLADQLQRDAEHGELNEKLVLKIQNEFEIVKDDIKKL
ncbi:MAG: response regulator [Pseudomonadota bacterium]